MLNACPNGSEKDSQAASPSTMVDLAADTVRKSAHAVAENTSKTMQMESGAFLGLSSDGPVSYLSRTITSGFILVGLYDFSALCDQCGPSLWVPGCAPSVATRQRMRTKLNSI